MIVRKLEKKILNRLGDKKALVILGPRQVGKTTLLKVVFKNVDKVLWLNGDNAKTRLLFDEISVELLKNIIGNNKYIIIDEAQRIKNIGIKMKLITDQIDGVQLIATGSSSLDLSNEIKEPLTGRKWEYKMFPVSFGEMVDTHGFYNENLLLDDRLIYGYYPDVVTAKDDKVEILNLLASDYLYKDILQWNKIKRADKITKLLQLLAYQVGNQVNYSELGRSVGLDNETVESYIDILEKAFIIFRLNSFSRNHRKELKKSKKIFFYDNGIRNALIANFSPLALRNDVGALWENFLISERLKYTNYENIYANKYFWRTSTQQEIDYIEDRDGKLFAYEFKWSPNAKAKSPKMFTNAYPDSELLVVSQGNYSEFLQGKNEFFS